MSFQTRGMRIIKTTKVSVPTDKNVLSDRYFSRINSKKNIVSVPTDKNVLSDQIAQKLGYECVSVPTDKNVLSDPLHYNILFSKSKYDKNSDPPPLFRLLVSYQQGF
jgi:hypothetical protein